MLCVPRCPLPLILPLSRRSPPADPDAGNEAGGRRANGHPTKRQTRKGPGPRVQVQTETRYTTRATHSQPTSFLIGASEPAAARRSGSDSFPTEGDLPTLLHSFPFFLFAPLLPSPPAAISHGQTPPRPSSRRDDGARQRVLTPSARTF
ncbi:hypothetical protein EYF80_053529 [Liparis tanakae]|uniref:Uncharacterized protein n=1 Tax=Liparis tanakae TaxID=230148 RepID=A0A4Z2F5F6_9TELE|nr:hypothetical protein EYF80_053529 [Liparis tanakae]